jgi:TetR/AcrR family transcriptional regulator, transcriptional repressor for nem operon
MYEAFTDKRGIFLAALARYCAVERERIAQMAAESQTPRAFIETLFESVENVSQGRGSFSFNTMVEFGTRDADVTAQLLDHYFKIVDIVADVLAQAQAARTITTKTPPLNLAHTILSTLQGVTTLKGVKPDFSHHHPVMRVVLSLLGECN